MRPFMVFCATVLGTVTAQATVIAFSPLVGANGAAYAGHVEGGFTVTPTAGTWFEAHSTGNPVPDIFSNSNPGTVSVTTTGLFTFASADFNTPGGEDYLITGFLGGNPVLVMS